MINYSGRLCECEIQIFLTNKILVKENLPKPGPGLPGREELPASSLSESFSQYPAAVQDAINQLKTQYELDDGDIETVVNSLWTEDAGYYEVNGD